MSQNVYQTLEEVKLLPLYTATDLSYLPKVEEILVENHVPLIEVTFRSKLAGEAIKQLSASGKLLVGAGTVRTLEEVKIAIENGATFIVSPAVVPEVIEYCLEQEIPIFPGTATPTDIQQAASYGIKTVKFFPADIYGGLKAINALSGPFYDIKFLPTGGINEENFLEYIENPNVVGIGGSFILSEKVIMEDNGVKMNQILQSLVEKINKL
ncbi:bifunctional 4-hydroxy-2-oxoglutarate aldolase/2-dehydro-3-deoxy-phosphogluconate aldolase [Enterococcus devriesei]|uniref:2-dehydro-3-deoxyphosphogluconate aldolase/4-hydroxy-2-oxoglutarate aldolase n=1 Tax=Enterococcus devriesei TaxID=319970 RepID=A0A1L8SPH9_9ENTE|nr:bifunctional 4-hydroxy-2-oxoglutarate aldolase/2-dehydro-3-deoxy-phosphogluconate aldolase [Enterococcus devriesei]MBU5364248.1 bifunctional 4-hydroxy-2-oxoglutarate aldolase/2-dehydro-3-deoxy-phosphogluconate aldolase [Enterococcus devriesei]MDT2822765.1 bifunctional 4-hydroxy-2-oxoglutarate aldolase/2-dehydro-3-deoxy-phosphogluconate aldolase [Enterococcus devriesei]OJG33931.1 2-dehydro-3-deoxyphosphogluconate aldolase/4-hydroxy-2-oxoglutarate aldolase [Enterococcus devriesei]